MNAFWVSQYSSSQSVVWRGSIWTWQLRGNVNYWAPHQPAGHAPLEGGPSNLTSPPGDCDAYSLETTLLKNTSYLKAFHLSYETFLPHPCRVDHIIHRHPLCPLYLLICSRILWSFLRCVLSWQPAHFVSGTVSHPLLQASRT